MPANIINPRNTACQKYTPILPGSSDTIYSTDNGRILFQSSNKGVLGTGGSSFSTSLMLGYICKVDTTAGSSGGSTIPIYCRKFDPTEEVEMDYSTLYSTVHPATTDVGNYIGLSSAATVAGAVLAMNNIGNAPGTSDARWLKITGFSTNRRKIYGFPVRNSSVIAW